MSSGAFGSAAPPLVVAGHDDGYPSDILSCIHPSLTFIRSRPIAPDLALFILSKSISILHSASTMNILVSPRLQSQSTMRLHADNPARTPYLVGLWLQQNGWDNIKGPFRKRNESWREKRGNWRLRRRRQWRTLNEMRKLGTWCVWASHQSQSESWSSGMVIQNACKILAKDLVRTRRYIQKFTQMRVQLQAVSLRMQTLRSNEQMATAMKGATRVSKISYITCRRKMRQG